MLNIALFGPPGAGKGTQSEFLIKKHNLFYISTGDLLRKEISEKTKLGLEAESIIASGGLVSDEIIVQIIEKTITENPGASGFLFDGFPRTRIQSYILEGLMIKLNTSLNCLISLDVDQELSVKRLLERGITSGRSDDNETVIRKRLEEYYHKTLPVLEFYKEKGIVREVDGSRSIEAVTSDIKEITKAELQKQLYNVVLFGYPGSGRGTQGKRLAKEYGLEYVSTSKMLEDEIEKNTEIGNKIKKYYDDGKLVPDEIVVQLIEKVIVTTKDVKGYIFKGFPRTLVQSYILDGLLRKHGSRVSQVFEIEVPMLELFARLDARSKTEECMPYDKDTTRIVQRLKEHDSKTVQVIEKYNQLHGVKKVDGNGTIDEVFEIISKEVQSGLKYKR